MPRTQAARRRRNQTPPPASKPPYDLRRASPFLIFLVILSSTFLAYLPALNGGLLWDDGGHVTKPELQALQGLRRIWFEPGATQQYYPLLHTAFWVEHRLFGDALWGYHLTNVFLHSLAALLVVMIVRRLGMPGAFLAGLVFALHPVCVEAVAWISEQKSTLSGVFYLAAAFVYLRFDQNRSPSRYFLATVLFLAALLSKSVTATLPAALLVIFWWQRGFIAWKRDFLPLLPWLVMGAAAGVFTAWVERTYIGAQGVSFKLTFIQRVLIAGRAIAFYLSKLVFPFGLTFNYPRWRVDSSALWQYLLPICFVAALTLLGILARRGKRGPLAVLLLFAGTLFPVLGFLNVYPFIYSFVADHFQYLASLAIIVPAAGLLAQQRYSTQVSALVVTLFGALTFVQSGMYRDGFTLYRETIARNSASWMAHNNLGNLYSTLPGRSQDAITEYREALRIKPNYAEAHYNLGNLLIAERAPDAIAEYRAGLRANPESAELHANLGTALSREPDQRKEALHEYRTALRLKPEVPLVHFNLANLLAAVNGTASEAAVAYREAIRLKPDYMEAHYNLGNLLLKDPSQIEAAILELQAAVQARPDFVGGRVSLGNAISRVPGRLDDAVAQYQIALNLDPNSIRAHYNLALALAKIAGKRQEALAHLDAVLQLNPEMQPARQMADRLRAERD